MNEYFMRCLMRNVGRQRSDLRDDNPTWPPTSQLLLYQLEELWHICVIRDYCVLHLVLYIDIVLSTFIFTFTHRSTAILLCSKPHSQFFKHIFHLQFLFYCNLKQFWYPFHQNISTNFQEGRNILHNITNTANKTREE